MLHEVLKNGDTVSATLEASDLQSQPTSHISSASLHSSITHTTLELVLLSTSVVEVAADNNTCVLLSAATSTSELVHYWIAVASTVSYQI